MAQVWLDTSGHVGNDLPSVLLEDGVVSVASKVQPVEIREKRNSGGR